jgi:NAD(P)-dependent dehydrogenase (short-subunit alcohol dehydrogenase family)
VCFLDSAGIFPYAADFGPGEPLSFHERAAPELPMTSSTLPSNPVVAITGCGRGLGRALVDAFAESGATVIAHARTEVQAREIAAQAGARVEAAWGDVRDAELPLRIAAAAAPHGGVDVLILNAGVINTMGPLLGADVSEFGDVMAINVTAQLGLIQAAVPGMVARGRGAVIWLTSGLGRFGLPGYGAYCASKHAVEGLMKVLAEEHGTDGIVSVAVAPGMVQTDMLKTALGTDDVSDHQTPEVTARGFVALAAGLAKSHNGQSLDIAGWLEG